MNCNNIIGSYFCNCDAGFIIDANGRTCDGMLIVSLKLIYSVH